MQRLADDTVSLLASVLGTETQSKGIPKGATIFFLQGTNCPRSVTMSPGFSVSPGQRHDGMP